MRITESRLRQIVKQMLKEAGAAPTAVPAGPPEVPAKDSGAAPVGQLTPEMMNTQLANMGAPQLNVASMQKLYAQYKPSIRSAHEAFVTFYNGALAKFMSATLTTPDKAAIEGFFNRMTSPPDSYKNVYIILAKYDIGTDQYNWFQETGPLLYATLLCAYELRTSTGPVAGSFRPRAVPAARGPAVAPADLTAPSTTPLAAPAAGIAKGVAKNWNEYVQLTTPPTVGEGVKNAWIGYAGASGQSTGFGAFVKWYNNAMKTAGKHLPPLVVVGKLNQLAKTAGVPTNFLDTLKDSDAYQYFSNPADPSMPNLINAASIKRP